MPFLQERGGGSPPTGCSTCHFEARGDIKVDKTFIFNHKRYIDRGIKCSRCHTNVVSGDGHIPDLPASSVITRGRYWRPGILPNSSIGNT